jgi:N-acetyl-gamma-glutamyl-phosphate reductase
MSEYQGERFVHVLAPEQLPQTNALLGSNSVHLQVALDTHVGRAIVIAALDNLGKGAAGQGIQNANLMSGFDESAGLEGAGLR